MRRVLEQFLRDGVLASLDHRCELPSTNTTAVQWLQDNRAALRAIRRDLPRLVITDVQTAGRGRLGRSWTAQPDGIAMSLILPDCHELLSISVGVAIAETIEHVAGPMRCGLKWPNDVWIARQKVAGTLIERIDMREPDSDHPRAVAVVGVGINVGSCPTLTDTETTSVSGATRRIVHRSDVLHELVPALLHRARSCTDDPIELIKAFDQRCVLNGSLVACQIQGASVSGRCRGIDAGGGMRIETGAGLRVCRSGEVSHMRPT